MTSFPSKRFSSVLVTTAAIGASIGIGSGLALRLAATTTGPGASFFHSEQSFPTLNGWPGEVTPTQSPPILPPLLDSGSKMISPEPIQIEQPQVTPIKPPEPEATESVLEVTPASPAAVPPPVPVVEPVPVVPSPPPTVIAPEPVAPPLPTAPEPLPPPVPTQPVVPPPAN